MEEKIYKNRFNIKEIKYKEKIWKILSKDFFQKLINHDSVILDIGAGEGYLIKNLKSREKHAIDTNPSISELFKNSGINLHILRIPPINIFANDYFDYVFISNFLEHLNSPQEVLEVLTDVYKILKPNGKVIILQPNFYLLGHEYFKFIDHKVIITHENLEEALRITGFEIENNKISTLYNKIKDTKTSSFYKTLPQI